MRFLTRLLKSLTRIAVLAMLMVVILLLLLQHQLIYHPRPYPPGMDLAARGVASLTYTTGQGAQEAFYMPPRSGDLRELWVMFNGNGSVALDWVGYLKARPDAGEGFLLIDYPGYGNCQGRASPGAIEESAEAAYGALAEKLGTTEAALDGKVNVMGVSLGCGAGLNFAVHHPVRRVILAAPFTSLRDMARRTVGWPLCYLLVHNFDNRARLAELAQRQPPPEVDIFHGDADTVIPMAMGERLAAMFPGMVRFHRVAGAGHNTVLDEARWEILEVMQGRGE